MRVEIDQSGRVEKLDTGTAVAFADGKHGAVFLTAGIKREIIRFLKKDPFYATEFAPIFFAITIYLLVKDTGVTYCIIDEEYTGKGTIITEVLLTLFSKYRVRPPEMRFTRIGKHSSAHDFAWKVHRMKGKYVGARKINVEEVYRLLKRKK